VALSLEPASVVNLALIRAAALTLFLLLDGLVETPGGRAQGFLGGQQARQAAKQRRRD